MSLDFPTEEIPWQAQALQPGRVTAPPPRQAVPCFVVLLVCVYVRAYIYMYIYIYTYIYNR